MPPQVSPNRRLECLFRTRPLFGSKPELARQLGGYGPRHICSEPRQISQGGKKYGLDGNIGLEERS